MRITAVLIFIFGTIAFAGAKKCSLPLKQAQAIANELAAAELRLEDLRFSGTNQNSIQYAALARSIEQKRSEALRILGENRLTELLSKAKADLTTERTQRAIVRNERKKSETSRFEDEWQIVGDINDPWTMTNVVWSRDGSQFATRVIDDAKNEHVIVRLANGDHLMAESAPRGRKIQEMGISNADKYAFRTRVSTEAFTVAGKLGPSVTSASSFWNQFEWIDVKTSQGEEISASTDGELKIVKKQLAGLKTRLDVMRGNFKVDSFTGESLQAFRFSSDKTKLLVRGIGARYFIRNLSTHKTKFAFFLVDPLQFLDAAFSPDHTRIVVVGRKFVRIYAQPEAAP